jgi:hypothetical protein
MPSKPSVPPLAKSAAPEAPSWDDVEPMHVPTSRDGLGLSIEDRAALGLSAREVEMTHFHTGDAHDALLAVMQQGGAIRKTEPRRKQR